MFIGQSCGWLLSRPVLWARHRRSQLRADPSGGAAPGTFEFQSGRPQADAGQTQHDQTRDGLHRIWENADGGNDCQRRDKAVVQSTYSYSCFESESTPSVRRSDARHKQFGYAWPLLLLLLIPLQDTRPVDANTEYIHLRQLFLRGYLRASQLAAEREGRRLSVYSPEWAAKFRVLEAEAMVWRGLYGDALRLLDTPSIVIADHDETIKRLTLKSVSLTRLHQFSIAEKTLSQAENLCASETLETCGDVPRARGVLALERGDAAESQKFFTRSLSFARSHHDRWLETTALLNLGASSLQQEHYDEAAEWSTLAHRAAIDLGGEDLAQTSLGNLGWAYFGLGDGERSLQNFLEARKSAARLGDPLFESKWITTAGYVFQTTGDYARASQAYSEALGLAKEINSRADIITSLEVLAHLAIETGKLEEAHQYIEQVAPLVDADVNRLDVLNVLFARGRLAAAQRKAQEAE